MEGDNNRGKGKLIEEKLGGDDKDDEEEEKNVELGLNLGLNGVKICSDDNYCVLKRNISGVIVEKARNNRAFESLEPSLGGSSSCISPRCDGVANVDCSLVEQEDLSSESQQKRAKLEPDLQDLMPGLQSDDSRSCEIRSCSSLNDSSALQINKMDAVEGQMDLSDDLLHTVLSFLGRRDICRAAMVCRQWRDASGHEDFWRCLDFGNRKVSVERMEEICRRYPRAIEVNLYGHPDMHVRVMRAVSILRNLEALTIGKGQLKDDFFEVLSDCPLLKKLVVCDASLGHGLQDTFLNHDMLQHLQVTKCRALRVSVRCPQLKTLSFKRSIMANVVLNCPLLQNLDISSCYKLPDATIRSMVTSCPALEYLDMSVCSSVTDETLREIAGACANLRELNASYCPNISLELVRMLQLTVLRLKSCDGITSASMAEIAYSNMLEVLELDNCNVLISVSLELQHLRTLRLVHCRKFVDLNLQCPALSSLTLSNCPSLHHITVSSDALKKLALRKQESLAYLSLQCPYLEEADLAGCEALTNSVCGVFSDGGGCPMVKSLVLDNCESLTKVRIHSTTLACLSLAGNQGLTFLKLTCANLEQVRLEGCAHLEKASFFPVGLQSLNLGICPKLNALHIDAPRMVSLELKGCGVLSEVSIDCPLLTSLDASFCSLLEDDCLSETAALCPLIEKLVLMSCPSITSDGLSTLNLLKNLTYLDLSYTFLTELEAVFKTCLGLTVLKLQACKYLNNSSLDALHREGALPALRELDLSYGTLCHSAIEDLLAYCTHLTHLSLNGCINMHDLHWGSMAPSSSQALDVLSSQPLVNPSELPHRMLQNLNCVGCPNIKQVFIPSTAQCVYLSSLNLSLSVNLMGVDIACPNLCFLNLSHCSSLEFLRLECPKLTILFLQACDIDETIVESAISGCSMLETLDVRLCPKITSSAGLRAIYPNLKRLFCTRSE